MPWTLAYAHDENGQRTEGEKADLIDAVRNGLPVRFLQCWEDDMQYVADAQWLFVWKDNVYAQNTSHLSIDSFQATPEGARPVFPSSVACEPPAPDGEFLIRFQDKSYWWMVLADTQGNLDMTRYLIGTHVPKCHDQRRVAMKWFVNAG
ncbi:MAG: hypothetical protein ACR2NZ_10200 [Rubripirellula sp.]